MYIRKGISAAILAILATLALAQPAQAANNRAAYQVYVWATNVNIRYGGNNPYPCDQYPSVGNCPYVIIKVSKTILNDYCQKRGQPISDSGYYSEWWSYVDTGANRPSGWISNVYIRGNAHLEGVPDCTF